MRRLLILVALPLVGAAPPTPASRPPADQPVPALTANDCRLLTETGTRGPVGKRNLADLPPADAYAAVWRTDEKGCPDPVLFRRR